MSEGKGRLFKKKDEKYLIYLPIHLAEDSSFPFKLEIDSGVNVKISFKLGKDNLLIEKWVADSSKKE